jgi:hypothetical protein
MVLTLVILPSNWEHRSRSIQIMDWSELLLTNPKLGLAIANPENQSKMWSVGVQPSSSDHNYSAGLL